MRRLTSILAAVALFWAGGFVLFVVNLPKPGQPVPAGADGVAVYTGGGGVRISSAMALFADGAGKRLLISGVHPDTSAARLSEFWIGPKDRFDCCVDLGRKALTTEGNAGELRDWAQSHRFGSVVLVTSEYHMPRAMAVTRNRMKDTAITAFPVQSGFINDKGRPTSFQATLKLAGEYSKYLLAKVKTAVPTRGR
ncbi:MAG: YdcF family protein [Pseudomonadota bacterium]